MKLREETLNRSFKNLKKIPPPPSAKRNGLHPVPKTPS